MRIATAIGIVLCASLILAGFGGFGQGPIGLPNVDIKTLQKPGYWLIVNPLRMSDWDGVAKPPSLSGLLARLDRAINDERYSDGATLALKIGELVPAKLPDDYPWNYDTAAQWRVAAGELLMLDGNFSEATGIFREVLRSVEKNQRSSSRQSAGYALALAGAATGSLKEARASNESAGGEYWSGCGNCMESEDVYRHLNSLVLDALASKAPDAALLALYHGRFRPMATDLWRDSAKGQREIIRTKSALMLGIRAMKRGDARGARKALSAALHSNGDGKTREGLLAWTLLKKVK